MDDEILAALASVGVLPDAAGIIHGDDIKAALARLINQEAEIK